MPAKATKTASKRRAGVKASDSELQLVADRTPLILVRCGRDLNYKFINQAGAALFGLTPDEIVGRSIIEVMGEKAFATIQPYVRTVLRGESVAFEAEVPYPAAGRRWMRVDYEPERNEAGKVIGWLASIVDITEIRAAQAARREYEERFSRFMRNLPGLAWIKDLDGRYVYVNHAAVGAFQKTREQLYGRTDEEIFPPDIAERFKGNDRRALEKGEAIEEVETLRQDDGLVHHSLVTKFPIKGPDGEAIAIGGMAIDITERVQAEAVNARLAAIVDSSDDAIVSKDLDGIIMSWNAGAERLFGYTAKETVGQSVTMLIPPERFDEEPGILKRIRRGEMIDHYETIRRRKDGKLINVSLTVSPIRDSNGIVIGASKIARDITERVRTENDLLRSQERFLLAQQAGGVGIWDWDISAGKTYWSETTWAFYGETPSKFNPDEAFWSEHIHEEDRMRVMQRLQDALDSGSDRYWDEFRIKRPDGSVLWIETGGTIVRDETGKATRVYGVNLDITRRREGEEALRRAHDELEVRVAERTKELAEANALLLNQMEEQANAERQRIRLLKKIVTIQEDERGRIARDLHDQLGQRFTALRLKIAALDDLCTGDDVVSQRVRRLQEISEGLDNEISHLAWQLRPAVLEEAGLVAALEQHVSEWSRHSGIPAEFHAFGLRDHVIAPDIETNLYRVAQEALNNAAKHSQASRATVLLERRENELVLIIEDDGVGFDAGGGQDGKGFGIGSMHDRAGVIAGTLEIESEKDKGATVFVRVPVD